MYLVVFCKISHVYGTRICLAEVGRGECQFVASAFFCVMFPVSSLVNGDSGTLNYLVIIVAMS